MLQRAIVAVQGKEALEGVSREELYRAVEDLCVHKMGARLYDRLKAECARHVAQTVAGLVAQQVRALSPLCPVFVVVAIGRVDTHAIADLAPLPIHIHARP